MKYATITGKRQKNAHLSKVYFVAIIFLAVKLITLSSYKTAWWDASVYTGMGKYIYSLGDAGLWENSRPIVWPLMLGFFWKIGINPSIAGKITEIILGSLCILLTYFIGKKIFSGKTGLIAAFFLAISPTFFFFDGIMLTEIASTFFALLAIYFLTKERHFLFGLFFGISFMTRFLQLFAFAGIIAALICNKKSAKTIKKAFFGFVMAVLPYMALNQAMYNNAFLPFIKQVFLTANSGWANHRPLAYYFMELFRENFLYLLFIAGIFLSFRKKGSKLVTFPLILTFLFFILMRQKEMRFLIILMPYMYLLVSNALLHFSRKSYIKKSIPFLLILLFAFSAIKISVNLAEESRKENKYSELQDILESSSGNIWVSSPIIAAESDKGIGRLFYYPVFGQDLNKLLEESASADYILMDACDLGCNPNDLKCGSSKKEMISFFRQKFDEIYSMQGECPQFGFRK